jgi:glycosyltransferase involved in cell wall biosynthesis
MATMSTLKSDKRQRPARVKVRILFVPGFVADTYSEIERSFIELCSSSDRDVEFLWLVPDISFKHNRFERAESRMTLKEPVWVPHMRIFGIPYVVRNISKYNPIANFQLFREIFRNNRIDAVYTHFGYERFWAALFGKLFGKVIIWNEHWHSLGRRYAWFKRIFYRFFVDDFISISRFITNTLPPTAQVHTILNAIHTDPPKHIQAEQLSELRSRLGIAQDSKVVLMVAAFRPEKRHMLALEVCKRALKVRNDLDFVFLGEGDLRVPFLAKVKDSELDGHVIAPGHVDNVEDYYAIANVSILTSHYEPFGYVVLEAMRHALPILAFNSGGPSEVIRNGETGFLAREGDVSEFTQTLLDLAENDELRATIGEKARQAVQQEYNREIWIKRLNATLRDIVVRHRPQSMKSS